MLRLFCFDVSEQHMQAEPNGQVQDNTDHADSDRIECSAEPELV
jgi:hypothetical protein